MDNDDKESSIHDNDPGRGITDKPSQRPMMFLAGILSSVSLGFILVIWIRYLIDGGDITIRVLLTIGALLVWSVGLIIYNQEMPKHKARVAKWQARVDAERAERDAMFETEDLNRIILDTAFHLTAEGNQVSAQQIADELSKMYPGEYFYPDYITKVCEEAEKSDEV